MIRNVKLFVAAHVAAAVALYALALHIGGGWADMPALPMEGQSTRLASQTSPAPAAGLIRTSLPSDASADRLPRHELELRSASLDQPAPWQR